MTLSSSYRGSLGDRIALRWSAGGQGPSVAFDVFAELKTAQKILVVPSDREGGLLLAAPVYSILRRAYPQAHIALLVDQSKSALASYISLVDTVVGGDLSSSLWSKKFKSLCAQLNAERYDVLFCLGHDCSFRLASVCAKSGARLRVGFSREGIDPFNIEVQPPRDSRYEVDAYCGMLELLAIDCQVDWQWSLPADKAAQMRARYGDDGGVPSVGIDISAGAGQKLSRRQIDAVVGSLIDRGMRPLFFFSLAERKEVRYLRETYGNRCAFMDEEDLLAAGGLLQSCKAFVACNTDLLHLAIALRVPTVAILGDDPQRWIGPDQRHVQAVQSPAIRSLNTARVLEALESLLK